MQQFRMPNNVNESNSDVVILIRVSDVYSEDLLSIDLFVDPWRLFNSNNLTFEGTWIAKGAIQENTSGSAKKRRKLDAPSVSWATLNGSLPWPSHPTASRSCLDLGMRRCGSGTRPREPCSRRSRATLAPCHCQSYKYPIIG
jgi:hypothetical protein